MAGFPTPPTLSGYADLLNPGLRNMLAYAGPRVTHASIFARQDTGSVELVVHHRLFSFAELAEDRMGCLRNFGTRVGEAILANRIPDGIAVTRERRAFLARAARVRKAKPRKVQLDG